MEKWFAAALLLLAIAYTGYGLTTLTLVTESGRPAAGFFPLVIGALMILSTSVNLWTDWREWAETQKSGVAPSHLADPEADRYRKPWLR